MCIWTPMPSSGVCGVGRTHIIRFGSRDGCITQGAVRGIEIPNSFSPPA